MGVLGDINFIRLSTDASYTTPILNPPIAGTYRVRPDFLQRQGDLRSEACSRFHLVGGIRTLTLSPAAHFTGPVGGQLADIDISATQVAGVAGFIYRPRLGNRVVLLTQADIGGGSAFTWSAGGGVEFLIKPWIGLAVGYEALPSTPTTCPRAGPGRSTTCRRRDAVRSRILA